MHFAMGRCGRHFSVSLHSAIKTSFHSKENVYYETRRYVSQISESIKRTRRKQNTSSKVNDLTMNPRQESGMMALNSQIFQCCQKNHWQEAFRLLSSSSSSKSSFPKEHSSRVERLEHNSFNSLMAVLLFNGYGESAFALWREASTKFNFTPSSMLMIRFAVYSLLVDRKAQEALDLVAMATLPSENVKENENDCYSCKKCFFLWVQFYSSFLSLNEGKGSGGYEELSSTLRSLLAIIRSFQGHETSDVPVKSTQLFLHAILSLVSQSAFLPLVEQLLDHSSFAELGCMRHLLKLLMRNSNLAQQIKLDDQEQLRFSDEATLPFLLNFLFPVPMVHTVGHPWNLILSGIASYQSFFTEDVSYFQQTAAEHVFTFKTVGSYWLAALCERGREEVFLRSVVEYDISGKRRELCMTHVLTAPLDPQWNALCPRVAQILFPITENVLNSTHPRGSIPLLALDYVSRLISPFISPPDTQKKNIFRIGLNDFPTSMVSNRFFYVMLLENMLAIVPHGNSSWERLIRGIVRHLIKGSTPDKAAMPITLRSSLHRYCWLPELLNMVDISHENEWNLAFQKDPDSGDKHVNAKDWNTVACVALRLLHEEWWEKEPLRWTYISDNEYPEKALQSKLGSRVKFSVAIQRTLMQRFIRWEWLLYGVWKFFCEGDECASHNWQLSNLVEACVYTLRQCREFHRNDIAKDLVEILFLPTKPFMVGSVAGESKSDNIVTLLVRRPVEAREEDNTVLQSAQWELLDEVLRWLPSFNAWSTMYKMQHTLLCGEHVVAQRFLMLSHVIQDVCEVHDKQNKWSENERERIRQLVTYYATICETNLSLRTPQLLSILTKALRRVGLLEELITLVLESYLALQRGLSATRCPFPSQFVMEGFLFFHDFYNIAVQRMRLPVCATDSDLYSHTSRENVVHMVTSISTSCIFALWENGDAAALQEILLKSPHSKYSFASSHMSESLSAKETLSKPQDLVFFLPFAEREALRILLVLWLARDHGRALAEAACARFPPRRADRSRILECVQRLTAEEARLFSPSSDFARRVASGKIRLREACKIISAPQKVESNETNAVTDATIADMDARGNVLVKIRTMRDLNRCIDSCNWAAALEAIPRIISDPLHRTRKALLACEKAARGTSWMGAMSVFTHAKCASAAAAAAAAATTTTKEEEKEAITARYTLGPSEYGRVMTLLADAKRWREALHVFESLGSCGVDGYIFTQACFALRASGHSEMVVGLWAMWRAAVGDAVPPTVSMCGQFVRSGVVGNTTTANAACVLIREAAQQVAMGENVTPGSELPLSFDNDENAIVSLLRDRWRESWQQALQVAISSGRPRIIEAVGWYSPSHHELYASILQQAVQEGRVLSVTERCALASHINLSSALASTKVSQEEHETNQLRPAAVRDRAVRVLSELLGEDENV